MATKKTLASTAETGVKAPAKKAAAPKSKAENSPKLVKDTKQTTKASSNAKSEKTLKASVTPETKKTSGTKKVKTDKLTATKKSAKKPSVSKPKAVRATPQTEASSSTIRFVVKYDVGYGNKVFLRGDAPGLSWEKGIAMENTSYDEWIWEGPNLGGEYQVKVLLNDYRWEMGENVDLKGSRIVHYPVFN